mgnify:CR=1 FL=1
MEKGLPGGLPPPSGPVMVLQDQAQFQPQAYVNHVAQLAAQAGARMFFTATSAEALAVRKAIGDGPQVFVLNGVTFLLFGAILLGPAPKPSR